MNTPPDKSIIKVVNVYKSFHTGLQEIVILKDISFEIKDQTFMVIFGPSGCGKSTLLHILLGLEPPTKGTVFYQNKDLYLNTVEDDRSELRKKSIGMVYQQANWIKSLTVIENVAFPLLLLGNDRGFSLAKAKEVLDVVGMTNWSNYFPTQLSSGQQQKIALARALSTDPQLIIADEPTGNLDFDSGHELMNLLLDLNNKGKTILMVTHDLEYLKYAKSAVQMLDGKVVLVYGEKDKKELVSNIRSKRYENLTSHGVSQKLNTITNEDIQKMEKRNE